MKSISRQILQIRGRQVLVEKVLVRLANIPDLPPVGTVVTPHTAHVHSIHSIRKDYPEIFADCSDADMFALRRLLREAWKSTTDPRRQEWFVFLLRKFHAEITGRLKEARKDSGKKLVNECEIKRTQLDNILKSENPAELLYHLGDSEMAREAFKAEPPALTKFEETFFHLQRNLNRAVYCKNPECPAPCFFRKKKGEEYCSPDCKLWGKRESKKNWWRENRGKRRRRRGS